MEQTSRRQFVAASVAGLPMLAYGVAAGAAQPQGARPSPATPPPGLVDPVLERSIVTTRELVAEGDARPSSRRASARAIEATLGIQATHVGVHYDAQLRRALRRRQTRVGRAALVDEVVKFVREHQHPGVTHELVDGALNSLASDGFAGALRDLQRAVRAARLNAPDAVQAAALPAQFDFCADVKRAIELAEISAAIICALAVLEPTLALEPFCAAATLLVAVYKGMEWWWC
jgi:hypothetical protein